MGDKTGYQTWTIAQPNGNFAQRNSHDIGLALEKIIDLSDASEVILVCHSKGGIDTRALLANMSCSFKNHEDFYRDPISQEYNKPDNYKFNSSLLKSRLAKIVFLATPHNGGMAQDVLGIFLDSNSPALFEMLKDKNYPIINNLNNVGRIPSGIKFANMTAYYQSKTNITHKGIRIQNAYAIDFNDGQVSGESSEAIGSQVEVIQMYQHNIPDKLSDFPHTNIHKNKSLTERTPAPYSVINRTTTLTNLQKIINFIKGTPSVEPCPRPTQSNLNLAAYGSVLSGASISYKFSSDSIFYQLGFTGENGEFIGSLIPALSIGDSIKIEVAGYETLVLVVNPEIISTGKIKIGMLKSSSPTSQIKYPALNIVKQNSIVVANKIEIEATGQNVLRYEVNYPFNQDSIFVPLALSNNIFPARLDTGYNLILVRYIGQQDTAILKKDVYYLPDSLKNQFTYPVSIIADSKSIGAKLYVNNQFAKDIKTTTDIVPLLSGQNSLRFIKFGYIDSLLKVDSSIVVNVSLQLVPHSYSAPFDSSIINFALNGKIQYYRNVTVMENPRRSIISVKQYDDAFPGKGLKPQTRKFAFRNLTSNQNVNIRSSIILDQIETPDSAKVYLLTIKNGQYKKYQANQTNVTEYDPEVQKLAFDSISPGANQTQELVLIEKQPPIMKTQTIEMYPGEIRNFPIVKFVTDPDSIKADIAITSPNQNITSNLNFVTITAPLNTGNTNFSLTAEHDFLTASQTYTIKVLPPEFYMPTAFTPNNDGKNDLIRPIVQGKLSQYRLTIFSRLGQKIFESTEPTKGWDGRINGSPQATGVYVYMETHQFEGGKQIEMKGTITLIR